MPGKQRRGVAWELAAEMMSGSPRAVPGEGQGGPRHLLLPLCKCYNFSGAEDPAPLSPLPPKLPCRGSLVNGPFRSL